MSSSMMFCLTSIDFDACVMLSLRIDQNFDHRSGSPHAAQHSLCRSFLSSIHFRGCLIAPERDLTKITIVGEKSILLDQKHVFQQWLKNQHVEVCSTNRVDGFCIEHTLRFSISYWLEAHEWYRVGMTLVQGKFLKGDNSHLCQIAFEVHCTSIGDVFLRISSEMVRFYPMERWQLGDRNPIEPRWATFLPKLGRGRIIAVHDRLPDHSPFENYQQMRAYWKNCYGYNLPEEEPEAYYDVLFNGSRSSFLYPSMCVLCGDPEPMRFRTDRDTNREAFEAFTRSLAAENRYICGTVGQVRIADAKEACLASAILSLPVTNKRKAQVKAGSFRPSFSQNTSQTQSRLQARKPVVFEMQNDETHSEATEYEDVENEKKRQDEQEKTLKVKHEDKATSNEASTNRPTEPLRPTFSFRPHTMLPPSRPITMHIDVNKFTPCRSIPARPSFGSSRPLSSTIQSADKTPTTVAKPKPTTAPRKRAAPGDVKPPKEPKQPREPKQPKTPKTPATASRNRKKGLMVE